MKCIAVFCGSSTGNRPIYLETARKLGQLLAERGIGLVYGGAKVGLMGAVADAVLEAGGRVTGVIPRFLAIDELLHPGLSELIRVESMHERKLIEYERSDGSISLPGGFGTLDEMFEMLTWGQLGLHGKPVALLNLGGYYDDLVCMADRMVEEGFLRQENREMLLVGDRVGELLDRMGSYEPPGDAKWIKIKQALK